MESFVEWGYIGLFLASFLAATVLPFSSEIVLSLLISNQYNFTLCVALATFGNWLGGMSSYGIGRLGKLHLIEKIFGIKIEKINKTKSIIDSWGSIISFFCWLPIIGDPLAVGLGFFRINPISVATWMFLGKLMRYLIWAAVTVFGLYFW